MGTFNDPHSRPLDVSEVGEDEEVARLAACFSTLSSPVRLHILFALAKPQRPSEVRLAAGDDRRGLRAERTLNRTTILHHLDVLAEAGLVTRLAGEEEGKFVVNQQVLFSLLDDVTRLARISPEVEVDVGRTRPQEKEAPQPPRAGPRFLIVGGPREGEAFPLDGDGPWGVGRGATVEVRLTHDPHVSRLHAIVRRGEDGVFTVETNASATNPALLDYRRLPVGIATVLTPGAVLALGSSRFVFRT